MRRTAEQWWRWHDRDSSRWSGGEDPDAATAEAEARCQAWVDGDSDDGPEPRDRDEEISAAGDYERDRALDDEAIDRSML